MCMFKSPLFTANLEITVIFSQNSTVILDTFRALFLIVWCLIVDNVFSKGLEKDAYQSMSTCSLHYDMQRNISMEFEETQRSELMTIYGLSASKKETCVPCDTL